MESLETLEISRGFGIYLDVSIDIGKAARVSERSVKLVHFKQKSIDSGQITVTSHPKGI